MKSFLFVSIIVATGSAAESWHLARDDHASELYARHVYPDGMHPGQFLKRSDDLSSLSYVLSRRVDPDSLGNDRNSQASSTVVPPSSPWLGTPKAQGSPSASYSGSSRKGTASPKSSGTEYYPNGWSAVPFDQVDFSKGTIHISKAGPMPDLKKPLPGPTAEHGMSPGRGHGNLGAPGSSTKSKLSTIGSAAMMNTPGSVGGRRPGSEFERSSLKSQGSGGSPKAHGSPSGSPTSSKSRKTGH